MCAGGLALRLSLVVACIGAVRLIAASNIKIQLRRLYLWDASLAICDSRLRNSYGRTRSGVGEYLDAVAVRFRCIRSSLDHGRHRVHITGRAATLLVTAYRILSAHAVLIDVCHAGRR